MGSFSRDLFCLALTKVLEIAEMNRRVAVLSALPDARIAIVSDYLPACLRQRSNIVYLGYIDDFGAVRDLMAKSKIVINTTNKFPQGSHERIWSGMAEGAVLLTDRSTFLDEDFTDGRDVLYLPQKISNEALETIVSLRESNAALQEIADRARVIYRQNHTWKQRILTLCDAVER